MTVTLLYQTIAALIGTIAFAVLFSVPRQYYLACGAIGAVGWAVYLLLTELAHMPAEYATFIASCLVVLLSRYTAVWLRCPATVFMITGVFPLIPGAGFYWTAYYLVVNDTAASGTAANAAIKAIIGLVLGIVCMLELPNAMFHLGRKRS